MNPRLLSAVVFGMLSGAAVAADAPLKAGLIDAHGEHVVLVVETLSPDAHYAAGWTVHPKKGKPAVKWSDYGKEGDDFRDTYCDTEDYVVTDVIVDLTRKAVVTTLQFTEPYFTGKGHGNLQTAFGPETNGHRYVLALSDSKWEPLDVVLVDLKPDGATQSELKKPLDAAVQKIIKKNAKEYATSYAFFNLPELGLLTGFSDPETIRVPFTSEIPKGEAKNYSGTVLLKLSSGSAHPVATVGEVKLGESQPDTLKDNPRLVAADAELNSAYTNLRNQLKGPAKAKLLEEQRAWLKDRDNQVSVSESEEQQLLISSRYTHDDILLRLTKERTAVLESRL